MHFQDLILYKNARILILGGGDGGLLKNILDLKNVEPKEIIMVELDNLVMEACAKHMRSTCGTFLDPDKRKGINYNILTEDALKFMELKIELQEEFDIIFGDLTDVPVETESDIDLNSKAHSVSSTTQETWKFIKKILQLALTLLKPETGRYYVHCNGKSVPLILQKYEEMLKSFRITKQDGQIYKVNWTQTEKFVPSFMEIWIFYQLSLNKIS